VTTAYLALTVCCKNPQTAEQKPRQAVASQTLLPNESRVSTGESHSALTLPTSFGRRSGDLDQMIKNRTIRVLVIINPIGFFYTEGRPQGVQYELLQEFETFLNQRLNTGKLPVKVVFLPMRPDQLESALTQGLGDIIAHGVVVTPEREQRVAFSTPFVKHVSHVVVTNSALATISSFDELAGKPIYVNPVTTYYENLRKLSDRRQKNGKPALDIRIADKNLSDDDLVQMVNANLLPATVTYKDRGDLWAQVLPNVKVHSELVVADEGEMAWAMRKNNPQLKQMVDEFFQTRAVGTSIGNTLLRRYLQNAKWIKNSLSRENEQTFISYLRFFKQYAAEYNFDYLMIAAQGYQESLLDQNKKSRAGAVGVMQVIPKLAAANPINIPDVRDVDGNIHAGTKMLHNIAAMYFNDPGIDPMNKTLLAFASYNAGPNRIAHLRDQARQDGLNPDKWFGNVELEAAKTVGQETVTYVSNIYKYYVAYKLAAEQSHKW